MRSAFKILNRTLSRFSTDPSRTDSTRRGGGLKDLGGEEISYKWKFSPPPLSATGDIRASLFDPLFPPSDEGSGYLMGPLAHGVYKRCKFKDRELSDRKGEIDGRAQERTYMRRII